MLSLAIICDQILALPPRRPLVFQLTAIIGTRFWILMGLFLDIPILWVFLGIFMGIFLDNED